jgi:hypothetical protein
LGVQKGVKVRNIYQERTFEVEKSVWKEKKRNLVLTKLEIFFVCGKNNFPLPRDLLVFCVTKRYCRGREGERERGREGERERETMTRKLLSASSAFLTSNFFGHKGDEKEEEIGSLEVIKKEDIF